MEILFFVKISVIMRFTWPSLLLLFFIHSGVVADDSTRKVTLFFTGFVQGTYEPCGCEAGPTGGLARRAGLIRQYSDQNQDFVIQVDLGSYFEPLGPQSEQVNKMMIESLDFMPVDVMNLSSEDLFLWKTLAELHLDKTKLISTNLTPAAKALPTPAKYAIVEVPGPASQRAIRVGFLGLTDPATVKPNSGFKALAPAEAIRRVKEEVMDQADFLVILADVSSDVATNLADEHPEIFAVLLAERRFRIAKPRQVNNAVILNSVERGRYLGRLTFTITADGQVESYEPEFTSLDDQVPEADQILRKQQALTRRLGY